MPKAQQRFILYERTIPRRDSTAAGSSIILWTSAARYATFPIKPVPLDVIENILLAASSAPSGAYKQPWTILRGLPTGNQAQDSEGSGKEEYQELPRAHVG